MQKPSIYHTTVRVYSRIQLRICSVGRSAHFINSKNIARSNMPVRLSYVDQYDSIGYCIMK